MAVLAICIHCNSAQRLLHCIALYSLLSTFWVNIDQSPCIDILTVRLCFLSVPSMINHFKRSSDDLFITAI